MTDSKQEAAQAWHDMRAKLFTLSSSICDESRIDHLLNEIDKIEETADDEFWKIAFHMIPKEDRMMIVATTDAVWE